jgi:CheY-like chemotaxis protein
MPGAGGLNIIQQIRQDRRIAKVVVVAVTAHAMAGDKERILSSGFDSYISKPVDAVILRKQVKDLLQAGTPV